LETTSFSCHMFKEMDHRRRSRNNFVDFSSFFLVEATGDSEADSDPNIHKKNMDLSANDEDDAESCSFDDNDDDDYSDHSSCVTDPIVGFRLQANQSWQRSNDYIEVEEEEEEGEEVVWSYNNKRWNPGQKIPKSCVSADSTNKSMNEAEKSKLFWETCLAS